MPRVIFLWLMGWVIGIFWGYPGVIRGYPGESGGPGFIFIRLMRVEFFQQSLVLI